MNKKVSVIIPVYNVAPYLERCLNSLAKQSLEDIEFICIDDGSTDQSGIILDQYAERNNKFKVFHGPNKGVSHARNIGLSLATGDYITFCDSDDYVDPNIYSRLLETLIENNGDIAICNISQITSNREVVVDCSWECEDIHTLFKDMFSWHLVSVNNKMFRRDLINSQRFSENCRYMEDKLFLVSILYNSLKINKDISRLHIPISMYHYEDNGDSLSHRPRFLLLSQTLAGIDMVFSALGNERKYYGYYGEFILQLAFISFWRNKEYRLSREKYQTLFTPYIPLFKTQPTSLKKHIVLNALKKKPFASFFLKLAYLPIVIIDKARIVLLRVSNCFTSLRKRA